MNIGTPILEYHDIAENEILQKNFHSPYIISIEKFYRQIKSLKDLGFKTITIDQLLKGDRDEKSIVLTFDDGHISNFTIALPILEKFKFVGTFFVASDLIGKNTYISKRNLQEMYQKGMEIGSHSLSHSNLVSLNNHEMYKEIKASREILLSLIKGPVNHFSVPYGFYNKIMVRSALYAGYKSFVTEKWGFYKIRNKETIKIIPRFTIKRDLKYNKYLAIIKRKKSPLIKEYIEAFYLDKIKKILGYKKYIYIKELIYRMILT